MGVSVHAASPAEVTLVEETLKGVRVGKSPRKPRRLICDRAYDSDPLRARLAARGIEQVTPHRRNRTKPRRQDGRKLRRYKRRWKIERTIAWLGAFRRLLVRWERSDKLFLTFVHLACVLIVFRYL